MLVEFTRRGARRVIGAYEWSEQSGYACQVDDAGLLRELFTQPAYGGDFAVHPDEPLTAVLGEAHYAQMLVVYSDLTSVQALADLSKEEAGRLAAALLETPRTVATWIRAAKAVVGRQGIYEEETAVPPTTQSMEVD